MTVTFTLTGGSASTDAGPFNISGTTSGGGLNGVSIATGITKQQLLTGHTVTNVGDTITGGTITSTGASCPGSTTNWYTTPTPTPTSAGGGLTLNPITISSGTDGLSSCSNAANNQYTFNVYTTLNYLVDGDTVYTSSDGGEIFVGNGGFYSDGNNFGKINVNGIYTELGPC